MLALLGLATWALSHSYLGIFHDAGLYTLQALAHLRPQSLPEDVFLKFGSQDHFTIFSPLYASVSRLLGVEHAAAALTLTFQLALLLGAWVLARNVAPAAVGTPMPALIGLLGVVVLIAVPGYYGADRVFTCIESFLTPRMAAEALTLGSLAVALSSQPSNRVTRRLGSLGLLFAAALLHPVMAAAGIAALFCLYVALPRPRLAIVLAAAGLLVIATAAFAMPSGIWGRFDEVWLDLVRHRSPYLFLAHWQLDDWARTAVTLATLTSGYYTAQNVRARTLCVITLVTVVSGLALTLIACDELHLVLFTQLQPWRWTWLGTVVAALILPATVLTLWGKEQAVTGRSTALLLIAAWIFASNAYALVAAVAALSALAFLHRLKLSEARWVFWGACGMLAIALVWRVASNLEFTDAHYLDPTIPLWIRRAMSFAHDGSAPMAVILLAFGLARIRRGRPSPVELGGPTERFGVAALTLLAALAAAVCVTLVPQTWHHWTALEYPPSQVARYAALRDRIPPGAEVFWPELPVGIWMLLNRPSYLSVIQTSGLMFSRRTALELNRRARALSPAVNPGTFLNWDSAGTGMMLSKQQLLQACSTGEFDFLVTGADLGRASVAAVPFATGPASVIGAASKAIRLYRCRARGDPLERRASQARAAAAST